MKNAAEKSIEEATPSERKFANSTGDWAARTVLFAIFLFFAAGKFTSNPNSPWVVLFKQIGFGQWFRYFTGILEVLGAFLVLIPQTVFLGLLLLMGTSTGAMLVAMIFLHRPADAVIPFALFTAMLALWMHRRRV